MLRKGQIVQIFQDPISEKIFEGEALLLVRYSPGIHGGPGISLERWKVEFLDDRFITERTINAEGKNKES